MNSELSFYSLMLNASPVVKLVVLVLVTMSIFSWVTILSKWLKLRHAFAANRVFLNEFWSDRPLHELQQIVLGRTQRSGPMERVFASGIREHQKASQSVMERAFDNPEAEKAWVMEGVGRIMQVDIQRQMDEQEASLSFLASVASVSPYIGLFGTVWGIMHAFNGLSALKVVTLATVAPGIAEALIATAIGLFAAIPAVLAYNQFTRRLDMLATQLDSFSEEFQNILRRSQYQPRQGQGYGTQVAAGAQTMKSATGY